MPFQIKSTKGAPFRIQAASLIVLLLAGLGLAIDQVQIPNRDGTTGKFEPRNITVRPGEVIGLAANGDPAGVLPMAADPNNAIDRRIAGKTGTTGEKLMLSAVSPNSSYTRSTTCWAADIDMTPVSVWCGEGGASIGNANGFKRAIAISPRHVVMAYHFSPPIGSTFDWVTQGGVRVRRTLTDAARISSTDLYIGKLDSDLPATISFCRILPTTHAGFSIVGLPALIMDQDYHVLVYDVSADSTSVQYASSSEATRLAMYEALVNHDSSAPVCLVVGSELVLLGAAESTFSAPSLSYYKTQVDAAMATLGGGYSTTTVDVRALWKAPPWWADIRGKPTISVTPGVGGIPILAGTGRLDPSIIPPEFGGSFETSTGGNTTADSGKLLMFQASGGIRGSTNGGGQIAVAGISIEDGVGVRGQTDEGVGVYGLANGPEGQGTGIFGQALGTGSAVEGESVSGEGGHFHSIGGTGIYGSSQNGTYLMVLYDADPVLGDVNRFVVYRSNGATVTTSGLHARSASAPTIASATTIAPTTGICFVSGTTTVATITAPSPISAGGGQITIIPTGAFATNTAGNIALATTAVPNKALVMTYDSGTAKWYPSY